jgi:hypothetical protein
LEQLAGGGEAEQADAGGAQVHVKHLHHVTTHRKGTG